MLRVEEASSHRGSLNALSYDAGPLGFIFSREKAIFGHRNTANQSTAQARL